jgi:hypothetical protein
MGDSSFCNPNFEKISGMGVHSRLSWCANYFTINATSNSGFFIRVAMA